MAETVTALERGRTQDSNLICLLPFGQPPPLLGQGRGGRAVPRGLMCWWRAGVGRAGLLQGTVEQPVFKSLE